MANVKYLSLEGLARTIAHIRLHFGASLSSSASATDYTVNLLNKSITPAIIGTAVINAATTSSAGVMTKTDKSNLDSLTTNAVKTINSGTGITVTKSGNTATVSLNAANDSTIGGIKVASVGTGALDINTANENTNKFAVHIDSNGLGYVAIPQYSNNQGNITGVTAGNGLTGGGASGSVTLNVGAGEGISVAADAVAIKAATVSALGGIKVWNKTSSYTVTATTAAISANVNGGKYYGVQTDKYDKAFVYVPWADIPASIKNPNPISFTAGTFTGTPSYDGSAAKTINIPTSITHLTRKPLTVGTKSYDGSEDITIKKEDLGLDNALVYRGIATESITEDSASATYIIGSKTYTATNGDVVFYNDYEFVWNGEKWERLGGNVNYKVVQQPLTDNTSGNGTKFVDTISQDSNGVITVTKKNVAFPTLSTATAASTAKDAIVLGGITVSGHTITAQTKTIVAGNNITLGTTTEGKIYISGTPDTTYTVSAPLSMSSNKISLTYVTDSTSTMLKASGTTAATFADTTASTATIVTHNKLGVLNNALCAEIDTITAYEIDALFS